MATQVKMAQVLLTWLIRDAEHREDQLAVDALLEIKQALLTMGTQAEIDRKAA